MYTDVSLEDLGYLRRMNSLFFRFFIAIILAGAFFVCISRSQFKTSTTSGCMIELRDNPWKDLRGHMMRVT